MKNLNGLKITISQMPVIPGRPDLDTRHITKEILAAKTRDSDLIIFPEMVHGYALGDKFEDECFIRDVERWNQQIKDATSANPNGIATVFGSVVGEFQSKGEDGRIRKYNSALLAQDGNWLGSTIKTLHPNYRIFDDDRHFFSLRKRIFEDLVENQANDKDLADISEYFPTFEIATKIGPVKVGVIICEDMWHLDYPINPGLVLAQKGIDLLVIISASPWTWQKNRKRHQVIKDLATDCRAEGCEVPIVYVNNTGIQNNGKNIIIFDGSSTVYNKDGEVVFEVEPYCEESRDFIFADTQLLPPKPQDDTKELFSALEYAATKYIKMLPPTMHKVVIGLSGGIDSSLAGAFWSHIVGPENVYGISMPGPYTSGKTKDLGKKLAENLGINFEIVPVSDMADLIAQKTEIERGTRAYENILARCRMEVLAATAQKLGGVFTNNGNKVEAAFGYCTRYADNAGFVAMFADLVKREVYQIGDYLNKVVYEREVIPAECFTIVPTAELNTNQKDPFDYGNLERRGYHDELVRALTEFRFNPEKILELYLKGTLESEFRLEPGHLTRLFVTANDFVKDLEKSWQMFHDAYSKRVETQPIPIISKRAFGFDLRESMLSAYLTQKYYDLKALVLSRSINQKRIAIYGLSGNPTARHHIQIAQHLSRNYDQVIVVICGGERSDKSSLHLVSDHHRAEMAKLGFLGLQKTRLDLFDLENKTFTPTWKLQEIYQKEFPNAQIWHVVGGDIITGGSTRNSEIHRIWDQGNEIWNSLNFTVITRPGYDLNREDLPPSSELIEIDRIYGSATMIRERLTHNEPISDLVTPEIENYIKTNKLYV